MANFVNIMLDTTAPASPSIALNGGATYATSDVVTATIGTADGNTTGYMMKIWGDVDPTYDTNIDTAEGTSDWIAFSDTKSLRLSTGVGTKTIYVKIRDDVYNESVVVNDGIIFDTTLPTVTVSAPDFTKVSKVAPRNEVHFNFTSDVDFSEYKIKVVPSTGSSEDLGTIIPITAGSINTSGTGTFTGATAINVTINGTDLETASSGDGNKIIKVFVRSLAGIWSA